MTFLSCLKTADASIIFYDFQPQKAPWLPVTGAKGLLAASFQQNAPEAMLSHASGVFSVVIVTT
jgi:hypothetical protein